MGGHLSGGVTGMASLRRTLAFMKWAAKEAKNDLDPLTRGTRGANRVMAMRSREFVDSILRTTGEDFDSSGDDVSEPFKGTPPYPPDLNSALHRRPKHY